MDNRKSIAIPCLSQPLFFGGMITFRATISIPAARTRPATIIKPSTTSIFVGIGIGIAISIVAVRIAIVAVAIGIVIIAITIVIARTITIVSITVVAIVSITVATHGNASPQNKPY
jgi:hypothetical protein